MLKRYIRSLKAATAIEYGLIAAGISLTIVLVVFAFGESLLELYESMQPVMSSMPAQIESNR